MFIYQKNKVNEVTGQVEQSLNVTFEDNKPVETPDVVITKDGVTGIKSDSKAYSVAFAGQTNFTSFSVDGEITKYDKQLPYIASIPFKKSFGFNVSEVADPQDLMYVFGVMTEYNSFGVQEIPNSAISEIGEYVLDIEEKMLYTPHGNYDI